MSGDPSGSGFELVPKAQNDMDGGAHGFHIDAGPHYVWRPRSAQFAPAAPMAHAKPAASHESGVGLFIRALVYPWMVFVTGLAGLALSAPPKVFPYGPHLHPVFGVAAFFLGIWLYRQLMTFAPTALALTLSSTTLSGLLAWQISDGATYRRTFQNQSPSWDVLARLPAALWSAMTTPTFNVWIAATVAVSLIAHASYWRHRRAEVRNH